jgi:23S rRNA pseudouridine1911/1915/1917 synthase
VLAADGRATLASLLAAALGRARGEPASQARARQLVMAGVVRVDGRRARRPGWQPPAGACVEAVFDEARLRAIGPRRDRHVRLGPKAILYEDAALIAVDKPPGLPSHATADPARPHLVGLVGSLLARRGGTPPVLGIHQRLDRDTSGVLLLVKDPAAHAGVAAAFAAGAVEKTYWALTARPRRALPRRWRASSAIGRPGDEKPAATELRVLETFPGGLLVEARPRTGRKHQVRIHLARAGAPILGDADYGARATAPGAARVMLHALRLELPHPLTGRPLVIESPLPADFKAALTALRAGAGARSTAPRRSRGPRGRG